MDEIRTYENHCDYHKVNQIWKQNKHILSRHGLLLVYVIKTHQPPL